MHVINHFAHSILSASLLLLLNQSALAQEMSHDAHMHSSPVQHYSQAHPSISEDSLNHHINTHDQHLQEHGGQIYQHTVWENQWSKQAKGQGQFSSELETWVGTDENKVFIRAHANKAESEAYRYDLAGLYSRNIATFWDAQIGLQYRNDKARTADAEQVHLMFGLQGLVPYYFETEAYVYLGEDDQLSFSLETERDILLTQKWIVQPYLNMKVVLQDHSKYAQKSGVHQAQFGIETRYEISKKIMPYIDIGYAYDAGQKQTAWQMQTDSDRQWVYGAGVRLKF